MTIVVSGDSIVALAYKEPSLLIPTKQHNGAIVENKNHYAYRPEYYMSSLLVAQPGGMYDLVTNQYCTVNSGSFAYEAGYVKNTGGAQVIFNIPDPVDTDADASGVITFLMVGRVLSGASTGFEDLLTLTETTANRINQQLCHGIGIGPGVYRIGYGTSVNPTFVTTVVPADGDRFILVGQNCDSGLVTDPIYWSQLWIDGKGLAGEDSGVATATFTRAINYLMLAETSAATVGAELVAIINGDLSEAQLEDLRRHPFSLLKPANNMPFVIPEAVAGGRSQINPLKGPIFMRSPV